MRLDLFLKLSRLCPRRSMAQDLCAAGLVLLNRQRAKSAHTVKAGDMISMRRADLEISVSREAARQMIEIVSEKPTLPID
ncbi:MAG: hypothetical protein DMF71_13160 [Acidobacteria bacterium]|nr:MAG: hypothetical protein DMF71_13160 [Acidobacteriota bacterium]